MAVGTSVLNEYAAFAGNSCSIDGAPHCRAGGRFLAAVTYCVRLTGVVRYSRAYTIGIYVLAHE